MSGKNLFLSIASLMFGVASCVLGFFGLYATIGIVCSIVAIILGSLQIKAGSNGLVVTGLILGIIGIVCCIFGTGCGVLCEVVSKSAKG